LDKESAKRISRRSRDQRFRDSRFHSRPWTAFRIRIYRPCKLWRIMGQYFGQKLFFTPNASGSRVLGLDPCNFSNNIKE